MRFVWSCGLVWFVQYVCSFIRDRLLAVPCSVRINGGVYNAKSYRLHTHNHDKHTHTHTCCTTDKLNIRPPHNGTLRTMPLLYGAITITVLCRHNYDVTRPERNLMVYVHGWKCVNTAIYVSVWQRIILTLINLSYTSWLYNKCSIVTCVIKPIFI